MTPMQTVLNNLTEFGNRLELFCRDLRDRTQDDLVRLLVHQIAADERRLAQARTRLSEADPSRFNVGSLTSDEVTLHLERVFSNSFVPSHAGKDALIDTVVELLDVMNSYYEWLMAQPVGDAASHFLADASSKQKVEIERLERMRAES